MFGFVLGFLGLEVSENCVVCRNWWIFFFKGRRRGSKKKKKRIGFLGSGFVSIGGFCVF